MRTELVPCTIPCALNGCMKVRTPQPISCIAEELSIGMHRIQVHAVRRKGERIALAVGKQVVLDVAKTASFACFASAASGNIERSSHNRSSARAGSAEKAMERNPSYALASMKYPDNPSRYSLYVSPGVASVRSSPKQCERARSFESVPGSEQVRGFRAVPQTGRACGCHAHAVREGAACLASDRHLSAWREGRCRDARACTWTKAHWTRGL